jgi:hypothetical protein
MDSEKIKITLDITSRLLNDDRMKAISTAIEKAIYDKVSKIDEDISPIFIQMKIENDS